MQSKLPMVGRVHTWCLPDAHYLECPYWALSMRLGDDYAVKTWMQYRLFKVSHCHITNSRLASQEMAWLALITLSLAGPLYTFSSLPDCSRGIYEKLYCHISLVSVSPPYGACCSVTSLVTFLLSPLYHIGWVRGAMCNTIMILLGLWSRAALMVCGVTRVVM